MPSGKVKTFAVVRDSFGREINAVYHEGTSRVVLYSNDGNDVLSIDIDEMTKLVLNLVKTASKEVTEDEVYSIPR
jgi:hypothetical protein